jgi:predicted aldo/keto reductase-like oxidoreductase
MDRRTFLGGAASLTAALAASAESAPPIPKRRLGKTNERLSIIGFGGIVVVGHEQSDADRFVREAYDRGVTYYDVAPSYANGEAEEKLGKALVGLRDRVFLACKTARRDRKGADEELRVSLARTRTNHFDLYQLHALTSMQDVDQALGKGGAIETLLEAKRSGVVRYLGFSAHSVDAALAAMERFAFDTILFPFNYVCYAAGNFGPQVLKAARSKGMGCLALKAMAYRPWPDGAERKYPKCWYEPLDEPDRAARALRFTLSEPITAAIPPGDVRLFRLAMDLAARHKPMSRAERERLLAEAKSVTPLFKAA